VKFPKLTWAQFGTCNQDPRVAFESMCRSFFNRCFFENKAFFHSNPNNPGIEIEPIFCKTTKERISFQPKYFSKQLDYSQILHSAEKVVEHYAGQIDSCS